MNTWTTQQLISAGDDLADIIRDEDTAPEWRYEAARQLRAITQEFYNRWFAIWHHQDNAELSSTLETIFA